MRYLILLNVFAHDKLERHSRVRARVGLVRKESNPNEVSKYDISLREARMVRAIASADPY